MKSAILIHLLGWSAEEASYELGGGVSLCRTEGSDVEKLYLNLCRAHDVDQGEPFNFPTHVLLSEDAHDELWLYWGGPYSAISRACNTITLCTSVPVRMCRLIASDDDFKSAWAPSLVIYEQSPEIESLAAYPDFIRVSRSEIVVTGERFPALNAPALAAIRACWDSQLRMMSSPGADNHRVDNALSFYFYAWRSYYMEQVCLNLAVALESLFSPASQHELSHQIAYNMSRFCLRSPEERATLYRMAKGFYALRSQIVHGGSAKQHELHARTPEMFHHCSEILKTILMDYSLVERFGIEKERKAMLDSWLFGG